MIHKYEQGGMHIVLDVHSGAIHVVDPMIYRLLDFYPNPDQEAAVAALSGEFEEGVVREGLGEMDALIEMGQLFSPDDYLDSSAFKKQPIIKALCLHVAHDCNIRCKYCFASQGDFHGERLLMPLETGKRAFDFLVAHSGNRRNLEVDFFGGEPLMNFEVVKALVAYGRSLEAANNKHFRFTITTNGILLDDDKIAYINEHMDNVVLSIDGRPEVNDFMRPAINGQGTYDVILPKFKKLVESRGDKTYYVRGTFTHFNTDFAKDVVHLADQGFTLTSVEPVVSEPHHDYTLTSEDMKTVFEQYESLAETLIERSGTDRDFKFFHFMIDLNQGPCVIKRVSGCGAGSEYIAVTPEGDIYPCHQFVGNTDFVMGNVDQGTFETRLADDFSKVHVYEKQACRSCWAKFYCSGGCHANAYNFNHDIRVPYEIGCDMEKKRIECAIYIKAKEMSEASL
ncbi:MAG: thioether cross-link-forming SCIFF peptide maturase [Acidaminobacter sp.]|uniref:thioether cross-link-forming SCIFF peptide maturase n=1 Tax=Acidaminobacter sp. TaxID=1872102 RepID=UPI00138129C0|nr:thioether cross-link-forming SCIFF peptide maturase [Acidaminobacter sp.]MZQ98465.1 thioether cross-link-forming SCIFF peptide maturase [Acidaminobacter sp.]